MVICVSALTKLHVFIKTFSHFMINFPLIQMIEPLISLPIALTMSHYNGELELAYNFAGWSSMSFYLQYLSSCVVGFVLMYSVVMCTHYNSPLTTTVTGCMKNLFVTYAGMVLPGGDYVYSAVNFIGINISVAGSLIYSYVAFKTKNKT